MSSYTFPFVKRYSNYSNLCHHTTTMDILTNSYVSGLNKSPNLNIPKSILKGEISHISKIKTNSSKLKELSLTFCMLHKVVMWYKCVKGPIDKRKHTQPKHVCAHTHTTDLNRRHKHTNTSHKIKTIKKWRLCLFLSVRRLKNSLIDASVTKQKKQSVWDKLMDHTLKMWSIYIFFYAQECWTCSIKKYKNKFKKTPTIQNNSLKGMCWKGGGGGNLSLLQSESPGSTANDQSTASHCSVEGTGRSGSDPGCQ